MARANRQRIGNNKDGRGISLRFIRWGDRAKIKRFSGNRKISGAFTTTLTGQSSYLRGTTNRVIALCSHRGRKVRTAKGNAPAKHRGALTRPQIVPQKITASREVRLKTWGKSPRRRQVTAGAGKPCMLKCHVYRRPRAARPMPSARKARRRVGS